jgi:hypothetical protein
MHSKMGCQINSLWFTSNSQWHQPCHPTQGWPFRVS